MAFSIFNKKLKRSCAWCQFGHISEYSNEVFCIKRGVTTKQDYCRSYKYDALKRVPERTKPASEYSPEDFKL